MKMHKLIVGAFGLISCLAALFSCFTSFGQQNPNQNTIPYFTYGKGLGITSPDSLFSMNIRFRIQNRAAFQTESESDLTITKVEARVRRLRLRFDGFVYNPKLSYVIQLSFTRGDMDYESLGFPNIIRDAYIQYSFTKNFSVGIGQTKLPGNRQRINSSGDLQFADRSIVNTAFNIDRDFGAQFHYKAKYAVVRGAISSGEGRNINTSDYGMAYTGRVDILPFGAFTNGGDYFEGDLAREKSPKVSLGVAYSHNENATRSGGQLGVMLGESTDIKTEIIDFLYKYNGWAFASEYIKRTAPSPVSLDDDGNQTFVYVGYGQNYQGSYNFKNNFEIEGRYSVVTPDDEIASIERKREHYTLGMTKYYRGHRVKLQNNLTLERIHAGSLIDQSWIYCFQVEVGI
jgi:phosphate-selective porin OprO and OprP